MNINIYKMTFVIIVEDASVPKLSSSEAVSVVIFPLTPDILYNRSPSNWTMHTSQSYSLN